MSIDEIEKRWAEGLGKGAKTLYVVRCTMCPFASTGFEFNFYCNTAKRRIPDSVDVDTEAPKWCPLRKRDHVIAYGGSRG